MENRRERKGGWTRNKPAGKKLVVTVGELYSLRQKLDKKYEKKDEARQKIFKLNKLYQEEVRYGKIEVEA